MRTTLVITAKERKRIWAHLLPRKLFVEQAAFIFADVREASGDIQLVWRESMLLGPEDFVIQTYCHIEIAEEVRGRLIKRAHDLGTTVVELHSHVGGNAQFSGSDLYGFKEWVPHVRWRLKGKPYAAAVVTKTGFDAFVWDGDSCSRLDAIRAGRKDLLPTGLSELPRNGERTHND